MNWSVLNPTARATVASESEAPLSGVFSQKLETDLYVVHGRLP